MSLLICFYLRQIGLCLSTWVRYRDMPTEGRLSRIIHQMRLESFPLCQYPECSAERNPPPLSPLRWRRWWWNSNNWIVPNISTQLGRTYAAFLVSSIRIRRGRHSSYGITESFAGTTTNPLTIVQHPSSSWIARRIALTKWNKSFALSVLALICRHSRTTCRFLPSIAICRASFRYHSFTTLILRLRLVLFWRYVSCLVDGSETEIAQRDLVNWFLLTQSFPI